MPWATSFRGRKILKEEKCMMININFQHLQKRSTIIKYYTSILKKNYTNYTYTFWKNFNKQTQYLSMIG